MKFVLLSRARAAVRRWWQRHVVDGARLPVTLGLAFVGLAMFASGLGYITISHNRLNAQRVHALHARNDIDALQALYLRANADFLQGFGSTRAASFAWPVERVGAAVAGFRRLEQSYADDRGGIETIHALRQETARWAWLLAEITVNAQVAGGRASVDSAGLLEANRLLAQIIGQLTALREGQTRILRAMSDRASRNEAIEGSVLALSSLLTCALLSYAFVARYRARLERQRGRLVAAENERRFRQYFEHHPLPMLIFDVETLAIMAANVAAAAQYGYPAGELCRRDMASLYAQADMPAFLRDLQHLRTSGTGSGSAGICRHRRSDGRAMYVDLSYHFLTYTKRDACFITAIDVTERKNAELALRLRSRALDAIGNGVLITRIEAGEEIVEYANPAFETITGYTSAQVVGRDHAGLARAGQQGLLFEQMAQALAAGSAGARLLRSRRADGSAFWGQLYVAPVRDDLTYHICVISDLTELIDSRDQLVRQARRDALTGLPNRATLRELIEQAVAEQRGFALLFMDVDRLKDINDSLGHGAGDRLLREVAQRLSGCVGDDGTVTRYGGDEFVAMLGRPDDGDRLPALLRRIARALERPVQIGDAQSRVQLSIGVACYPADGLDAETLLKHADLAMYQAKARGRNTVELFQPSFAEAAERRIALSHRLRAALEHDGFELAYQPQIDVRTSRVSGVEALLRWHDPEMGAVSPATFIPLAEDIGLIGQLGEWVLRSACGQAKRWADTLPALRVSVNVSPRQLASGDFCSVVRRVLDASGLPAHQLELEITEGALVAPGALPALRALNEIGVLIAIDDFGTGYSSLSYLRTFHADRLKIDMSFVRGIGTNCADEAIIRAILALARSLHFEVVAEGVERSDQLSFLVAEGCPIVQGYHFCRAVPAAEIPTYVRSFSMLSTA
ncbi:TPA: EAL domain-containing protein [Burkholderia vietnamiensis]|nr:EAL domain-containing protein [Burkholderia vietnamiensis]